MQMPISLFLHQQSFQALTLRKPPHTPANDMDIEPLYKEHKSLHLWTAFSVHVFTSAKVNSFAGGHLLSRTALRTACIATPLVVTSSSTIRHTLLRSPVTVNCKLSVSVTMFLVPRLSNRASTDTIRSRLQTSSSSRQSYELSRT